MANEETTSIKDLEDGNIVYAKHMQEIAQSIFWNYEPEEETPTST